MLEDFPLLFRYNAAVSSPIDTLEGHDRSDNTNSRKPVTGIITRAVLHPAREQNRISTLSVLLQFKYLWHATT